MSGADVKQLQEILRYEGFFNYPIITGYLGGITRAGVIKLQNKYASEILHPLGLKTGTGLVGVSTLSWLKKNYGI
jgi:peptidoglycan hydrolase-like protein with peptidoglycan-binding domain